MGIIPDLKHCPKCGRDLPRSEFHKNRKRHDGLASWCRSCFAVLDKKRNAAHRPRKRSEQEIAQRHVIQAAIKEQLRALPTKVCQTCGHELPRSEFHKAEKNPDGLFSDCKDCRRTHYYDPENLARKQKYDAQRRIEKAEYLSTHRKARYRNDVTFRKHRLQYEKERRIRPEARERERQRHYKRQADPEYRRKKVEYARNRRHNDPEYRRKVSHWRRARRARIRLQGTPFTHAEWVTLCEKYDHRCLCCGEMKPLTPDHIVPVSRGGSSDISNIQPLCLDCNRRKSARTIDYRPSV